MASFKVGDKVRFVGGCASGGQSCINTPPIGCEGLIVRRGFCSFFHEWDWVVDFPAHPEVGSARLGLTEYLADSCQLTPILDSGTERDAAAERFLSNLRKLGREPVTLTEKELLRVSGGGPSGCAPIVGRGGK